MPLEGTVCEAQHQQPCSEPMLPASQTLGGHPIICVPGREEDWDGLIHVFFQSRVSAFFVLFVDNGENLTRDRCISLPLPPSIVHKVLQIVNKYEREGTRDVC